MRRGDIYATAGRGDFSNTPRPSLIVQSDLFNPYHPSVTVCPISSTPTSDRLYRIEIAHDAGNGLNHDSEIEVDKVQAIWIARLGDHLGRASDPILHAVDEALRRWLDL